MTQEEYTQVLRDALQEAADWIWNPFEPDNQSKQWWKLQRILALPAPQSEDHYKTTTHQKKKGLADEG